MTIQIDKAEIDHIAEITSDAYSADRYTSWRACVALLVKRGYSYEQTATILYSSWMRFAADDAKSPYRATSADLARFLDNQPNLDRHLADLMGAAE